MTVPLPCYLRGTHICTPEGEQRIEELKIGDAVVTLSGESKPIKWIGRRRFNKSFDFWPKDFEPIRISRFALDDGLPHRDLYVSPMHAIYIDGVLIPAKHLVNGRSITQCAPEGADVIEYLHIELSAHDVIHAEGVAAETFAGNYRDYFDNFAEFCRRYPQDAELQHARYAPVYGDTRFPKLLRALRTAPLRHLADPFICQRPSVIREKIRDRLSARAADLVEA
jgi:Hint domain